jgi:hypothetical protein
MSYKEIANANDFHVCVPSSGYFQELSVCIRPSVIFEFWDFIWFKIFLIKKDCWKKFSVKLFIHHIDISVLNFSLKNIYSSWSFISCITVIHHFKELSNSGKHDFWVRMWYDIRITYKTRRVQSSSLRRSIEDFIFVQFLHCDHYERLYFENDIYSYTSIYFNISQHIVSQWNSYDYSYEKSALEKFLDLNRS